MLRSILIVFAFSLSSLAETHPAKRFYPALSVATGLGCKGIFPQGTSLNTFCDKLILAGMFAAGDEIGGALIEYKVVNSTRAAHLAAASTLLAIGIDHARNPEAVAQYSRASATNQVGGFVRDIIKDVPDDLQTSRKLLFALSMMIPWLLEHPGVPPTTFLGKLGVSQSFTTAYMVREAMLEAVKSVELKMPELIVATVMAGVGAVGMGAHAIYTIPYFVYLAILDAGAFTFVDEAVKAVQQIGVTVWTARVLAAMVGAVGYKNSPENSVSQSVATTFFYPLAFSITYEAAQQLWSYMVDRAQEAVGPEDDL